MKSQGSPYSVAEENNEADSTGFLNLSHLMSKIQQKIHLVLRYFFLCILDYKAT